MGPDELVPVTARALARARWEDAADFASSSTGRARAEAYYGARIAGTAFENKLIGSARAVLARAAALSAAPTGDPAPSPDPLPDSAGGTT